MLSLDTGASCFLNGWKHELNQPIPEALKHKALDYVHSTSIDIMDKLIANCWHYVPAKLHKNNPAQASECWRMWCERTHTHIWWQCPMI